MNRKPTTFKSILKNFQSFLQYNFNLHEDVASENQTIERIKSDVTFRGANLWILIFAILVCSVGLNVNSTAVVIGAMLISPLMGPIMGVGLGIGIYDFELIISALRNLLLAAAISVIASAIYFWISPLDVAQSELLARTQPTVWDVFIALAGGLAGIVAATRIEKSNAIPGVAIATALMPPLCTAGYGIATLQWSYFFGAIYLFFINSVFISISTYLIISVLKYPKREFLDATREKRVKRYILVFVLLAIIPSTYTAYNVVRETIFRQNANSFIKKELIFENCQIINSKIVYENKLRRIQLTLFGEPIDEEVIEERRQRMNLYNLKNVQLIVRQGYQEEEEFDLATIEQMNRELKSDILEDLFEKNEALIQSKNERISILETEIIRLRNSELPIKDLASEAKIINTNIGHLSLSSTVISNVDSMTFDTLVLAYVDFKKKPKKNESPQIENWLMARLKLDRIKLLVE